MTTANTLTMTLNDTTTIQSFNADGTVSVSFWRGSVRVDSARNVPMTDALALAEREGFPVMAHKPEWMTV